VKVHRTEKGVSYVDCGLPSNTFNTVFGRPSPESASHITADYQEKSYPAAWWLTPSASTPEAKEFLRDQIWIFDLATHPSKRQQGYGHAMFSAALRLIKSRGVEFCVLQASPHGVNIYPHFGFKPLGEFHVWSNKNTLVHKGES